MRIRTRLLAAFAIALASAVALACQSGVTGPSLSATVSNLQLQPSVSGLEGGQNVCCCHVTGRVTNTSSVGVHIELIFPAKDAAGQVLGVASDIQRDVAPNGVRDFVAVGILAPCRSVGLSQVTADKRVRVMGLWEPPQ